MDLPISWPDLYSHIINTTTHCSSALAGPPWLEPVCRTYYAQFFLEFSRHQVICSPPAGVDTQQSVNDCRAVKATQGTRAI